MSRTKRTSIAIVTGASSGMGKEAVLQLADRYAGLEEIWVVARRRERLLELEAQSPTRLRIFSADLEEGFAKKDGQKGPLRELERALEAERPAVRFLVNAAGFGKSGPSASIPMAEEAGMVRVNCEALCAVTHMVLPYLVRGARILQFASAAAFLPQPEFAVYAASKAFVVSYSRALGEELKERGIVVTAVCPGPVRTEFLDAMGVDWKRYPLYKRLTMAGPERVVRAAIRDSIRKKHRSVYGVWMKSFFLASRLLPQGALLALSGHLKDKGERTR